MPRFDFRRFLLDRLDQVQVTADNLLEQVHARREVAEVPGAEKHIQVVDLTVFIDIAEARFVDFHPPGHFRLLLGQDVLVLVNGRLQGVRLFLQGADVRLDLVQPGHDFAQTAFGHFHRSAGLTGPFLSLLGPFLGILQFLPFVLHGRRIRRHGQQGHRQGRCCRQGRQPGGQQGRRIFSYPHILAPSDPQEFL